MKVYYFTIIAIGLMFTLNLAGINTGSHQILDLIGGTTPSTTSNLWIYIGIALIAFTVLTSVSIGGFAINKTTESIVAALIYAVFAFFLADMYSIVSLVGTITNFTGWMYFGTWAVIIPLMAGYGLSLIDYIRGTD
jgi:hypothetical protein